MNLMFWKKKNGAEEDARENMHASSEQQEALDFVASKQGNARQNTKSPEPESTDADEEDLEAPVKHSIAASIKMRFSTLVRHFKKPPVFRAGDEPDPGTALPDTALSDEPVTAKRSKKWLVIGISSSLLVLLLVALAIVFWPISEPPREQAGNSHESASDAARSTQPKQLRPDVETLRRENAELQAQVEALKKQASGQPQLVPPSRQAAGNGSTSIPPSGDMVVGSKDPKATAMSLKEAIEAMNASTGGYEKKPAK